MTWFIQSDGGAGGGGKSRRITAFFPAKRTELHNPIQFLRLCALACGSEHLRAEKRKILEMVHKPHRTTHADHLHQLAAACTNLHQLAEKFLRKNCNRLFDINGKQIGFSDMVGASRSYEKLAGLKKCENHPNPGRTLIWRTLAPFGHRFFLFQRAALQL